MAKSFEKVHTRRIVAMILVCALLLSGALLRAFRFQVVEYETYAQNARQSTAVRVPIPAARGQIVDCNGIPLAKNKAEFNLELDFIRMKKDGNIRTLDQTAANDAIADLIETLESFGEEWIDELPITMEEPYTFLPDASESAISRLKSRIAGVNEYADAEDCMYWIYRTCAIRKYEEDGKCTHCGKKYAECDFAGYSEEMCRKIAGVRYQMLLKDFSFYNSRVTVAENVSRETVAWLSEQQEAFPGVRTVETSKRIYVSGDVASHILGTVGPIYSEEYEEYRSKGYSMNDIVGKDGIEKAFESELRGEKGELTVLLDSKGEVLEEYVSKEPVAGKTLRLTIDSNFQREVQQILSEYIADFNAHNTKKKTIEGAAVTVLDTATNGLRASVSYPYYDIRDYIENYNAVLNAPGKPLYNRALQGLYRPGSTFKPVVATAGLSEGVITPQSEILCTGTYLYYAPSYTPSCLNDRHGHVPLNVSGALNVSCNVFFFEVGRLLGIDRIRNFAALFGLGEETGLEISAARGRIASDDDANWNAGDVIQAAIGQATTQITPLQMAIEASTIANHGTRYQAHLVHSFYNYDQTELIETYQPQVLSQFDLQDAWYSAIVEGMIGAGRSVAAPNQLTDLGYTVAVKTGTPQVSLTRENNGFICFAPVEHPEIAISCMLEDGEGANRIIRKILLAYEKSKGGPAAYPDPSSTIDVPPTEPDEARSSEEPVVSEPVSSRRDEEDEPA